MAYKWLEACEAGLSMSEKVEVSTWVMHAALINWTEKTAAASLKLAIRVSIWAIDRIRRKKVLSFHRSRPETEPNSRGCNRTRIFNEFSHWEWLQADFIDPASERCRISFASETLKWTESDIRCNEEYIEYVHMLSRKTAPRLKPVLLASGKEQSVVWSVCRSVGRCHTLFGPCRGTSIESRRGRETTSTTSSASFMTPIKAALVFRRLWYVLQLIERARSSSCSVQRRGRRRRKSLFSRRKMWL